MADNQNDIKSISISVTAKTAQAQKQLDNLLSTLSKMADATKSIKLPTKDLGKFVSGLVKIQNTNLDKLPNQFKKISEAFKRLNTNVDAKALRAMAMIMNANTKAQELPLKKAKSAQAEERARISAEKLKLAKAKEERLAQEAVDRGSRKREQNAGVGDEAAKTSKLSEALKELGFSSEKVGESLKKLGSKALSVAMSSLKFLAKEAASAAIKVGKTFASAIISASAAMGRLAVNMALSPWKRLGKSIADSVKSLTGFLAAVKRIAVYRAIRWALKEITNAVKEGMDNLYQYSLLIDGKFYKSMDMLATSALYVKNSLAAMVSPIVNELAPAVDYLADQFVDLLNTVNETIAAMTGAATWTKAIKYPISYAEAADDANKKAKDLRATLLGFDEINRLDDNRRGSRGSAEDQLDYLKMFEEKTVDTQAKGFVQRLKEAFASGDLTSIGESIGKSLLTGLNNIPWGNIESAVTKNASRVATLINGFISVPELGATLGKSIAKSFNVAVAKMNKFFSTVNWGKVGDFFADGINAAVSTFKIDDLAENFALIINGASTALSRFTSNVNWSNIATFLTNGINSAVSKIRIDQLSSSIAGLFKKAIDTIGSAATKVEWNKLGSWLAGGINGMFAAFKSDPPIGKSIANIFNGAITTLGRFANDVEWSDIGTFLGDNINKFLDTFEIKDLGKKIAGVINGGFKTLNSFLSEVKWEKVGEFLGDGINSFFTELEMDKVGKAIKSTVVGAITAVIKFFETVDFEDVGKKIADLIENLPWTELLSGVGSLIMHAIGASFDVLKGLWEKSPALAIGFGIGIANLIAGALGLPKVTSIISSAVLKAVTDGTVAGAAGSAATSAGVKTVAGVGASTATTSGIGSILGASVSSLPVAIVGVAAIAAGAIGYAVGYAIQDKIPSVAELADKFVDYTIGYNKNIGPVSTDPTDVKNIGKVKGSTPSTVNEFFEESARLLAKGISGAKLKIEADSLSPIKTPLKDLVKDVDVFDWSDVKKTKTGIETVANALGGNTSGGKAGVTSKITVGVHTYASGGEVQTGSLFLAGEAGAEIVSSAHGKTSVANRDQIADSVAIGNEESNEILREQNYLLREILAKDTTVVNTITTGQITSALNRANVRSGNTVVAIG